jgi:hypothetical protein
MEVRQQAVFEMLLVTYYNPDIWCHVPEDKNLNNLLNPLESNGQQYTVIQLAFLIATFIIQTFFEATETGVEGTDSS